MSELPEPAWILRALTSDRHVRVAALDAGPLWDGVRRGHPQLEAGACAVLVQLLSATQLLQSRNFFSERLQLLLKTSGAAKAVVSDSWPDGGVRGMLDLDDRKDGGSWIEAPGLLQVMRSTQGGTPYVGRLEMVEGPLETQIEAYLQQSEQVNASVSLWCDPSTGEGGGLLVEPMPGCPPERMEQLIAAIEGLEVVPLWERAPEFLVGWVNRGEGAEILSRTRVEYVCRCSRDSLVATLNGFGQERVKELFLAGSPMEVRCDYCGKVYSIAREDLDPAGGQA